MLIHGNRRQFLAGTGALGLSALTPWSASAADQIVVATWGGDTERALRESAGVMMAQEHGVEVLFDTGTPSARKTKLMAEASRPRNSIDAVHLTDLDMYQMNRQNYLAKVDPDRIPNHKNIFPEFVKEYSIPTFYSALVLVYNRNHISSMTSWKDFWKSEYAGRIGFTDLSYDKIVPIASWTFGQTTDDYEPGKEALLALKESGVRIYPSNEAAGNAFASEEIIAAIQWKGRAVQWSRAGLPLDYAVPVEGGLPSVFEMGMTRNSGSPEHAEMFLNTLLEPGPQIAAAQAIGQAPVTSNVTLPDGLEEMVSFSAEERANFIPINFEYASNQAGELLNWWEQVFKGS